MVTSLYKASSTYVYESHNFQGGTFDGWLALVLLHMISRFSDTSRSTDKKTRILVDETKMGFMQQ